MERANWIINEGAAVIGDDAMVYRITSPTHCNQEHMLNGMAPRYTRTEGRWHRPQQPATYASNNLIVCMAEVLYHSYRSVLDGIRDNLPPSRLKACYTKERVLQIARVGAIQNLAHLESDDFRREYKVCGTATVYPDPYYKLYQNINDDLRGPVRRMSGVVYPSARHSRDYCAVLFDDETQRIKNFWVLPLRLSLLHEDQRFGEPLIPARPDQDKMHPTMGYYEFDSPEEFQILEDQGIMNPSGLPPKGFIDFVRRRYPEYPKHAVCHCM